VNCEEKCMKKILLTEVEESVLNCTENYIRKVLLPDDRNPGGKCMDGSQSIMTKLTEKVSADKADKSERIDLASVR